MIVTRLPFCWSAWTHRGAGGLACSGLGVPTQIEPASTGRTVAQARTWSSGNNLGRPDRIGSRYGLKLSNKSPDSFKRMRVILGYYDLPTSLKSEEPSVESVNISTLQTLKYLPLARDLKKRLLDYKTISLNRDLEGLHALTRNFLGQLHAQEAKPVLPSFMMGKAKRAE